MHNAHTAGSVADDRQAARVAGPTSQPGDRPAWSTPRLTPLLLGGTQAGGALAPDGLAFPDTGSI
ncbi:MAG TPA: hypothetical protein VF755_01780 [Catenuloplanes sp.]|jgi:hypothetical protein